jgi:vitamin B12 transporter
MKKRGYFSLVVLLITTTLFATTDIGIAGELVITGVPLAEAEQNTASTVSVITEEEIKAYNAQSTAELVGKSIGVTYSSFGSLGAAQNAIIRGASPSKSQIFLNGSPLGFVHDGTIDLSIIPISLIKQIEVIKSGTGNLGRTNAIGGMVNIITHSGATTSTPFTLSFENGSFIPLNNNWRSLVDSQRLDLSYSNNGLFATAGTTLAQNAYPYGNPVAIRENAHLYEGHGALSYTHRFSHDLSLATDTVVTYKNLGVPGSLSWGLTPDDYQNDLLVRNANTLILEHSLEQIRKLSIQAIYAYGHTFYHDAAFSDSTHAKHNAILAAHSVWETHDSIALFSDLSYSLDYVDSTDVGKNARHTLTLASNGSFYVLDGALSLHPSANVAYVTDMQTFSPNASLGIIYTPVHNLDLKASINYAERIPTFSELYWPFMSNPNLKSEHGVNTEMGFGYIHDTFKWEGSLFARDITNEIQSDPITWIPYNNAHSLYLGTEQNASITITKGLKLALSYQYNKSFNLSDGKTLSDNIEMPNVRKHTAKASLDYSYKTIETYLEAQLLGKNQNLPTVVLVNLSISWQTTETLRTYLAIDNLLNTEYELSSGYPMPGTKLRLVACNT